MVFEATIFVFPGFIAGGFVTSSISEVDLVNGNVNAYVFYS